MNIVRTCYDKILPREANRPQQLSWEGLTAPESSSY
jgi:hypothetical protein